MGARTRAAAPHRDKSEEDRAKKAIATSTWRHGVVCTGERWRDIMNVSNIIACLSTTTILQSTCTLHLSCSSDATVLVASAAAGLGLCLYST